MQTQFNTEEGGLVHEGEGKAVKIKVKAQPGGDRHAVK